MRSNARSQRKSRFFRELDCDFLILIAISISTCSHLFSKSLGGLSARWTMFGFGILLAPGESRRVREWAGGCSGLGCIFPVCQQEVCKTDLNCRCQMVCTGSKSAGV